MKRLERIEVSIGTIQAVEQHQDGPMARRRILTLERVECLPHALERGLSAAAGRLRRGHQSAGGLEYCLFEQARIGVLLDFHLWNERPVPPRFDEGPGNRALAYAARPGNHD